MRRGVLRDIVLRHGSARIMRTIIETIGGLWQLFLLAVHSRFRVRSAYWRWRRETAFGSDPARHLNCRQRFKAMIDYGRWVHRMKRAAR